MSPARKASKPTSKAKPKPSKRPGRPKARAKAPPATKPTGRKASGAQPGKAAKGQQARRHCAATDPFGDPCQSAPRLPSRYCTIHSYLDR